MKKIIFLLLITMPLFGIAQKDSTIIEDDFEEIIDAPLPPPYPDKKEVVVQIVEKMAEYPGGNGAMSKFIQKNLKYPKKARKKEIEGRVIIQFVINKEGKVTKAKILRDIGYGCGEEALKVVNKMPKWKPATQRGKPVKVMMTLPFNFKLE